MKSVIPRVVLICAVILAPSVVSADLVISYDVNIVQTSINVGDTIDWQVFANVTGAPNVGSNLGIAVASLDLVESQSNSMTSGTVGPSFAAYTFQSGGTPGPTGLTSVGATMLNQNIFAVAPGAGGSFLLASGQYVATTAGVHTLQAALRDASRYFSAGGQAAGVAPFFDVVNFGSDSVTVNAVPEPSSLLLAGLAALGGWRIRRRRLAKTSAI
jgi:hypothetical protein